MFDFLATILVPQIHRAAVCSATLVGLLAGLCLVCATEAQYSVEVRTVDDGLPQNTVSAILQTRDGYVWLATNGGLARYDGVRFKTFEVGNTTATPPTI